MWRPAFLLLIKGHAARDGRWTRDGSSGLFWEMRGIPRVVCDVLSLSTFMALYARPLMARPLAFSVSCL